MGWSADIANPDGRKFEEYDIYWLEEPVRPTTSRLSADRGRAGHARGRGETHFTRYDCGRSSSTRACRSCIPIRCAAG